MSTLDQGATPEEIIRIIDTKLPPTATSATTPTAEPWTGPAPGMDDGPSVDDFNAEAAERYSQISLTATGVADASTLLPPTDGRQRTSPGNGHKGGRPGIDGHGLALTFVERHCTTPSGDLTLQRHGGLWYEFDGVAYSTVGKDTVAGRVEAFLQTEAARRKAADPTSKLTPSRHTRDEVITNLQSTALCVVDSRRVPCWLPGMEDASGWLPLENQAIHVENMAQHMAGLAPDLTAGEYINDLTPRLFTTLGQRNVPYDPAATCPRWTQALEEWQPVEADRLVLQQLCGLALIPSTAWQVFFVLYGQAGTGKSTFLDVLRALVGESNCCSVPLSALDARFSTVLLTEKLLNIVGDLATDGPDGSGLHRIEGTLKEIACGGTVSTERKHQNYDPTAARPAIARIVVACNTMPHFVDRSDGIWDRLRVIPFSQKFRGTSRQEGDLDRQLQAELPGVLVWAIQGLATLLRDNPVVFPEHSEGLEKKAEHRQDCDPERRFLEENYEKTKGHTTSSERMWEAWRDWASDNGYRSGREAAFVGQVLMVFGVRKHRETLDDGKKLRVYRNLRQKLDPLGDNDLRF